MSSAAIFGCYFYSELRGTSNFSPGCFITTNLQLNVTSRPGGGLAPAGPQLHPPYTVITITSPHTRSQHTSLNMSKSTHQISTHIPQYLQVHTPDLNTLPSTSTSPHTRHQQPSLNISKSTHQTSTHIPQHLQVHTPDLNTLPSTSPSPHI